MPDNTRFSLDIQRYVKTTSDKLDLVVRRIALDFFSRVIEKSPVGNPDLWAANKHVMDQRDAKRAAQPSISDRTLARQFPLAVGATYVGGRFKSNWQVAIGALPPADITDNIDLNAARERVQAAVLSMKAGDIIYMANSLPYARALEYGHSTQAPAGMVRITSLEFNDIAAQAASEVT